MMGAGKSTVGKALAKHLSWEFIDTDHLIEQQTGVSIPVIFEIEGVSEELAHESLRLAAQKLPVLCKAVTRYDYEA